ncbi:MAG: DUF3103 domain-containing protein [Bacteroidales bacterium]|nr:DUF3103 domain-containing protein [Bacteroidales bacterium]
MRNIRRIVLAFVAVTVLFSACQQDEIVEEMNQDVPQDMDLREIAVSLVDLLNEGENFDQLVSYLEENKYGNTLENILNEVTTTTDNKAGKELKGYVELSNEINLKAKKTGKVQTPELWMFQPAGANKNTKVLVSYVPKGDEKKWKKIEALDKNMKVYKLDPKKEPQYKVIVVEADGMAALKKQVKLMNDQLKSAGLQKNLAAKKAELKAGAGLATTQLKKIKLHWDHEPWIKGAAEVYAVTSGLRKNKEVEINIIDMPYIDWKNKEYYPNQIMLFWDNYEYQAANIQLFEKDSGHNYKNLTTILVNGVFDIAGTLTAQPWVVALGQVASAIVQAMPDDWYKDNDEYLDSFYTIEKGKTYKNRKGAAGNAVVNMQPKFIPNN